MNTAFHGREGMPVIPVVIIMRPVGAGPRGRFQRTRARAFGFSGASKRVRNCSGGVGARDKQRIA